MERQTCLGSSSSSSSRGGDCCILGMAVDGDERAILLGPGLALLVAGTGDGLGVEFLDGEAGVVIPDGRVARQGGPRPTHSRRAFLPCPCRLHLIKTNNKEKKRGWLEAVD